MRKYNRNIILFQMCIIFISFRVFAEGGDTISLDRRLLGSNYYYQGKLVDNNDRFHKIFFPDSAAESKFLMARTFLNLGLLSEISGAGLIVFGVGKALYEKKPQWSYIGTGLVVAFIIPIPFAILGGIKLHQAVILYNEDRRK